MNTRSFVAGFLLGAMLTGGVAASVGYAEVRRAWDAEVDVKARYDAARVRSDANVKSLAAQVVALERALEIEHVAARGLTPTSTGAFITPSVTATVDCSDAAARRVIEQAALGTAQQKLEAFGVIAQCVQRQNARSR